MANLRSIMVLIFACLALPAAGAERVDFARDVHPILAAHCFKCHAGQDAESGFRFDLKAELLGETNGEPAVIAGKSADSKLIQLVSLPRDDKLAMPPAKEGRGLTADEIATLRAWIDQGVAWDDNLLPPETLKSTHWSFQPVTRPEIPRHKLAFGVTPIDAFIAEVYEQHGVAPLPPADKYTLLRRVTLDLTGLPPTPDAVAEFIADTRPDSYERLVERLLASPRYGERWGRHWLDVARYADSEGYESNHPRLSAWKYRDWTVAAFNADKPFDHFLREQIAGDELMPYDDANLIATGFLAAARLSSNEEDKPLQRSAVLIDIVNATASGVLGLTMSCAQCHNHKFDPLTQRDYYALLGFFVRGQPNNLALADADAWRIYNAAKPAEYDPAQQLKTAIHERTRLRVIRERREKMTNEERAALDKPAGERTPAEQELARAADLKLQILAEEVRAAIGGEDRQLYDLLAKKLADLEKQLPEKPQVWGFYSPATSPHRVDVLPMKAFYPLPYQPEELRQTKSYLYVRGDVHRRGPDVSPAWPAVLGETPASLAEHPSRSALVDWLVDKQNPLTARVWVNRVWQHHFGRGLVASSDDFGTRGEKPSHPELLDYLASELIDSGWSTKHLHRLIVLSDTYRLASRVDGEHAALAKRNNELDPENRWLWRYSPRRLEAEAIRDSALLVSGELEFIAGGKPEADEALPRRTVYLTQKREAFPETQRIFDGPSANDSCARRNVSTVSLQPLYLLNGPFALGRAEKLAQRVARHSGENREAQINAAFAIALGRPPDETELAAAREYFAAEAGDPAQALVRFCQAVLNLNEFVYLE